jgi:hypothetical protein
MKAIAWSAIYPRSREATIANLQAAAMRHAGAVSLACERAYGCNEHTAALRAYRVAMHYYHATK